MSLNLVYLKYFYNERPEAYIVSVIMIGSEAMFLIVGIERRLPYPCYNYQYWMLFATLIT